MKKYALAISVLAISAVTATAADMAPRTYSKAPAPIEVYNWTGFYVGANSGGGWSHNCWTLTGPIDAGCHDGSGGLAGGQAGYNWQMSNFVLGVELSGDWANLKGNNIPALIPQGTDSSRVSSIVMATARAGFAMDRALIYGKGGAAWVRENYSISCNGVTALGFCVPVGFTPAQASETRTGWTVGVGLEYLLTRNLSLGIEYDYIGLGNHSPVFSAAPGYDIACGAGVSCPITIRQNVSVVTARLNWHFGGPVVARY